MLGSYDAATGPATVSPFSEHLQAEGFCSLLSICEVSYINSVA
jgi:hypothetical protein